MIYDKRHVFINGEAFRAGGRDATLMRRLADGRALDANGFAALGADARALLDQWAQAGWLHADDEGGIR
jgi:50S ribosomal protein L16 3-hydroxylase